MLMNGSMQNVLTSYVIKLDTIVTQCLRLEVLPIEVCFKSEIWAEGKHKTKRGPLNNIIVTLCFLGELGLPWSSYVFYIRLSECDLDHTTSSMCPRKVFHVLPCAYMADFF